MRFERGMPRDESSRSSAQTEQTGTQVVFKPDPQIFRTTEIEYEIVAKRLREMAYLMGTRGDRDRPRGRAHGHRRSTSSSRRACATFVQHINKNKSRCTRTSSTS